MSGSPLRTVLRTWRAALSTRAFAVEWALSVLLFAVGMTVISKTVPIVEARQGAVLADPVLALFSPVDVTWPTFTLVYGGVLLAFCVLVQEPKALAAGIRAYGLICLFRTATMLLAPLDPPAGMLVLRDPFVEGVVRAGTTPTRDLFFSGHTGTLSLMAMLVRPGKARAVLATATVAVAACVLAQKVHYTVDVVCAPPFALLAAALAGAFRLQRTPAPGRPTR